MRNGHGRANIAGMGTDGIAGSGVKPSAFGCITVPFVLIALVPLLWGARSQWSKGALLRAGETMPGTIVELRHVPENPSTRNGKGSVYSPVFRFAPRGGTDRTVVGHVNRYPAPWKVGEVVDVVYDPADPARADLRSELEGWSFRFAVWCLVALLPLAIAAAPAVLVFRARRR